MSRIRALGRYAIAGAALLLSRRGRRDDTERPRLLPAQPPNALAEIVVATLFLLTALASAGFVAVYVVGADTQYLGLALGLAFAFLGAALGLVGKTLVPQEEETEERGELVHEETEAEIVQMIEEGGDRITRKRFVYGAGGAAAAALGGALVVPVASLGPFLGTERLSETPWYRGRRLVDETGRPLLAEEIEVGAFYTGFPEGAPKDRLDSPLIVIRLPLEMVQLPAERRDWAPDGIMAYSKICPHAGCAVSIYRWPLYEPSTPPEPALICPCHFSTFDPRSGGTLKFGPAGRDLPQLPIAVDAEGVLRASSGFPDNVGPSWWGVRLD